MPDLTESLQGRDLGICALLQSCGGLELDEQDIHSAITQPNQVSFNTSTVNEMISSLAPRSKIALE